MNAAAGLVEVRVPDMGNFKDVAIIDVLVKPGEKIEPEAPLVTLETEKATMDVPSTVGGVVEQIHISKGGTVSTGDLIVTVRQEGADSGSDTRATAGGGGTGGSAAGGEGSAGGDAASTGSGGAQGAGGGGLAGGGAQGSASGGQAGGGAQGAGGGGQVGGDAQAAASGGQARGGAQGAGGDQARGGAQGSAGGGHAGGGAQGAGGGGQAGGGTRGSAPAAGAAEGNGSGAGDSAGSGIAGGGQANAGARGAAAGGSSAGAAAGGQTSTGAVVGQASGAAGASGGQTAAGAAGPSGSRGAAGGTIGASGGHGASGSAAGASAGQGATGAPGAPGGQGAAGGKAGTSGGQGAADGTVGASGGQGAAGSAAGAPGGQGNGASAAAALASPSDLPPINEPGFSRAHAGPSVRRFARELGVDLTQVKGNGFKGRVTHDDVKAFVKTFIASGTRAKAAAAAGSSTAPGSAAKPASAPSGGLPSVPVIDFSLYGPVETKPLTRIQKISGPRLHASWVNLPHVTQFDEADITDLEDTRNQLKERAQQRGIKLTPLAFIVRACVRALQELPLFNSSLDPKGANLILKKYIHIGFAADTPNGLVVPVIHDADRKDIYEIARILSELSEKARAGKLTVAEMQGGSFTISSLGGIGGTAFTPIINAPEVAILGVSKSSIKPVFRDGAFVPRLMLPLSLSYDHRVIDGASAARFTTFLAKTLADPRGLTEAVP